MTVFAPNVDLRSLPRTHFAFVGRAEEAWGNEPGDVNERRKFPVVTAAHFARNIQFITYQINILGIGTFSDNSR